MLYRNAAIGETFDVFWCTIKHYQSTRQSWYRAIFTLIITV